MAGLSLGLRLGLAKPKPANRGPNLAGQPIGLLLLLTKAS